MLHEVITVTIQENQRKVPMRGYSAGHLLALSDPPAYKGPNGSRGKVPDAAAPLADIYAHCAEERFIYWHCWEPGDLIFWDNRCVLHIADHSRLDDPTYIRHMHRTTIAGDVPY